jgi:hypothetical protein
MEDESEVAARVFDTIERRNKYHHNGMDGVRPGGETMESRYKNKEEASLGKICTKQHYGIDFRTSYNMYLMGG